jgi:TIR domain
LRCSGCVALVAASWAGVVMRIFLSYRREDSAAWAGRLHDSLAARFGERSIFQDVVAVQPGEDFTDAIDRALSQSEAALVVIGPRWLTVTDAEGARRLDQPDDFVRTELIAALAHQLRVIPVLVGGATMPSAAQLPSGLEPLAQRQAVALRDTTWHQDLDTLLRALRGEQPATRQRWPLVAAGSVVVLIAAVVVTVLSRDNDGSNDDTGVTGCPGLPAADFTELTLTDTPSTTVDGADGTWGFEVDEAYQRQESAEWNVVLVVTATNDTGPSVNHDYVFYELVVDGVQFDPWCFSLPFGKNPLEPGSSNVGLVGFLVPVDPATTHLELGIDMDGSPQRIPLTLETTD